MIDAYIYYSGVSNYLPMQLALLRKNVQELDNIFLVQGPTHEDFEDVEGTKTLVVPNLQIFHKTRFALLERITSYIMQEVCLYKPNKHSFFLHSDLIPVRKMYYNKVLNGRVIAGRTGTNKTPICPNLTWVLFNNRVASKFKTLYTYKEATTYPAPRIKKALFSRWFPESNYEDYEDIIMQYCEPGFIHLEDTTRDSTQENGMLERKTELLENNFLWLLETTT